MQLIGVDKESEEAALSRLAPPLKALPAPTHKPAAAPKAAPASKPATKPSWEDEIPF